MSGSELHVTRPKSPRLLTNFRHRPIIDYKTPEQREQEEIEQLKAKIKARKEKARRLLETVRRGNGHANLPRKILRTVPVSPKFQTARRATLYEISDRQNAREEEVTEGKTGKTEKASDPLTPDDKQLARLRTTIPRTPKLATRARAAARPSLFPETPSPQPREQKTPPLGRTIPKTPNLSFRKSRGNQLNLDVTTTRKPFKARSMPNFARQHARYRIQPRQSFSRTVPEPFNLSTTNKTVLTTPPETPAPRPMFKARPMPNFEEIKRKSSVKGDWSVVRRKSTIPDPFQLRSEILHVNALRKIEEEERMRALKEEQQRRFKARPLDEDMLQGPLFVPKLAHQHTERSDDIQIHSTKRAVERAKFEEERKKREEQELKRRETVENERRLEEETRLKEERKAKAFKARLLPLSHFHPDVPDAQSRPATSPHTPALKTLARAKSLHAKYNYIYDKPESERGGDKGDSEATPSAT